MQCNPIKISAFYRHQPAHCNWYGNEIRIAKKKNLKKNKIGRLTLPVGFTVIKMVQYYCQNRLTDTWEERHGPEIIPCAWTGGSDSSTEAMEERKLDAGTAACPLVENGTVLCTSHQIQQVANNGAGTQNN